MRDLLEIYYINAKTAVIGQFQYRVANILWFIGMLTEPIIYLVVWSTIAESQGGSINGFDASGFAAYYIGWTIVRYFNITLTPWAWEGRIKDGNLSPKLLLPVHPIHSDLGFFIGWKIPWTVYWIPIGTVLIWIFKPDFQTLPWHFAAFAIVIFTGFVMRFLITWALGLITFWVTRVNAIFQLFFTLELLFSGRLVPMALMPEWAVSVAKYLPFQWAFSFPIELLMGRLDKAEVLNGFGYQLGWGLFGFLLIQLMWKPAIKKYSAVGA